MEIGGEPGELHGACPPARRRFGNRWATGSYIIVGCACQRWAGGPVRRSRGGGWAKDYCGLSCRSRSLFYVGRPWIHHVHLFVIPRRYICSYFCNFWASSWRVEPSFFGRRSSSLRSSVELSWAFLDIYYRSVCFKLSGIFMPLLSRAFRPGDPVDKAEASWVPFESTAVVAGRSSSSSEPHGYRGV